MKSLRLTEQQYASLKKRTVKLAAEVVKPQAEKPDRWPLVLRDQIVEAGLPEPFREFVFHPTRG